MHHAKMIEELLIILYYGINYLNSQLVYKYVLIYLSYLLLLFIIFIIVSIYYYITRCILAINMSWIL